MVCVSNMCYVFKVKSFSEVLMNNNKAACSNKSSMRPNQKQNAVSLAYFLSQDFL